MFSSAHRATYFSDEAKDSRPQQSEVKSGSRGGKLFLCHGKMLALEVNAFLESEPRSPEMAEQGI